MANIKITLPDGDMITHGKILTFQAPCFSGVAENLIIQSSEGEQSFRLVDANCDYVTECSNAFTRGAMLAVTIDTQYNFAYLINSNVSAAVQRQLNEFSEYIPGPGSIMKMSKAGGTTNYSTSKNTFFPFVGEVNLKIVDRDPIMGSRLFAAHTMAVSSGDRENEETTGIIFNRHCEAVRLVGSVRYRNNDSSCLVHTYINKLSAGSTQATTIGVVSCSAYGSYTSHTFEDIISVEPGDFIFLSSYKGTASRDIDVMSSYGETYLIVEVIKRYAEEPS